MVFAESPQIELCIQNLAFQVNTLTESLILKVDCVTQQIEKGRVNVFSLITSKWMPVFGYHQRLDNPQGYLTGWREERTGVFVSLVQWSFANVKCQNAAIAQFLMVASRNGKFSVRWLPDCVVCVLDLPLQIHPTPPPPPLLEHLQRDSDPLTSLFFN